MNESYSHHIRKLRLFAEMREQEKNKIIFSDNIEKNMSGILTSLATVLTDKLLSPVAKWCACNISECICGHAKHEGILLPFLKTSLKNNLTSESTLIVDLDAELEQSLDDDDKKLDPSSHLYVARLYNNAKKIVSEIAEMNEISKKLDTILFVSSDYKMLKYCGCDESGIDYFIPSDGLHEDLKKASNWNEDKYQGVKARLMQFKANKLKTYSCLNDLIKQITEIYPDCKVKI